MNGHLTKPLKVFFCYARKDEKLRNELEEHLSLLTRLNLIVTWHDRKIQPGEDWKLEINTQLDSCDIVLLLVSSNFFNSDYCYSVEMCKALERHENKKTHLIPIILNPVDWQETPIGKLQVLPTNAKPISSWKNRSEAYYDIVGGLRHLVEEIYFQKLVAKGNDLYSISYYSQALEYFTETLNYKPPNVEIMAKMAYCYLKLRQYYQAIEIYDRLIMQDPTNSSFHLSKAFAHLSFGDYEKALEACEVAICLEPDNADFQLRKSSILIRMGRFGKALEISEKFDKKDNLIDPINNSNENGINSSSAISDSDITALMNKGDALFFLERYEEVLDICERLLRQRPTNDRIFVAKGVVLIRLKRYRESLASLEQAIRLNPSNSNAYHNLAYAFYYLGRIEEAKKAHKMAHNFGRETSQIGHGNTIWE